MPSWSNLLIEKYLSRTIATFILHGNVDDLVAWNDQYLPLQSYLNGALFGKRQLVFSYDRGGGLTFATPEMQQDFQRSLDGYDAFHGSDFSRGLPRNPDSVLMLLENYLRVRLLDGKKIALTIDFADTIAPAGEASELGS
jgi:hypothetical protein